MRSISVIFTTDVQLIRFRADADESVRITLPDLLRTATCRLLGIEVAEVMATYSTMYGNMTVILYDRTPGGAPGSSNHRQARVPSRH